MIRCLLVALWLALVSVPALGQTQPCLDLTYTWTIPYSKGTIQSTSYSVTDFWFQVLFFTQVIHLHDGVPVSVATQFQNQPNGADAAYNSRIKGHYPQALLNEKTACPLLNEATAKFLDGQQ